MTDDTRSRWEKWRRNYVPHHQIANRLRARTAISLPPPSISLVVLSTWPETVQVLASGLSAGQVALVTRTPAGSTTATTVRGFDNVTTTTRSLLMVDAEAPFGVLLTYALIVDEVAVATATVTLTLSGGKVALTDAISGDAAEVVVLAWPEKRWERPSSVFSVAGRNIVVSGQVSGFTGSIDLFVETIETKRNVLNLLETATGGIVQIRQPGPYDGVDAYFSALSFSEQRYSQDGTDERRILSLDVVETTSWAPTLDSSTFTLGDIAFAYPGGTLQAIANDYLTLQDLAMGDFS